MKKAGIIHAELIKNIALLGHKDLFLIGDAGMPVPKGVEMIDLALCEGIPSFEQVLEAVLKEAEVEYYYMADEIHSKNERLFQTIENAMPHVSYETMPHEELKKLIKDCKFAIRTGEYSPYPNVVLRSGVVF